MKRKGKERKKTRSTVDRFVFSKSKNKLKSKGSVNTVVNPVNQGSTSNASYEHNLFPQDLYQKQFDESSLICIFLL